MVRSRLWSLFIPAALAFSLFGNRSAEAQITGKFVTNSAVTCLSNQTGFSSSFQALGTVHQTTSSNAAFRTFNSNGTGSVQGISVSNTIPVPPGTFATTNSDASQSTFSYQFTYTVAPNGIITSSLVPGTYHQSITAGPRAGQTATQDKLNNFLMLSSDGHSFVSVSGDLEVETKTFSAAPVTEFQVCHRNGTGILVPG